MSSIWLNRTPTDHEALASCFARRAAENSATDDDHWPHENEEIGKSELVTLTIELDVTDVIDSLSFVVTVAAANLHRRTAEFRQSRWGTSRSAS
jgi:hypothetical protein